MGGRQEKEREKYRKRKMLSKKKKDRRGGEEDKRTSHKPWIMVECKLVQIIESHKKILQYLCIRPGPASADGKAFAL